MAYRYTDPNTRAVFSPTQGYANHVGKTAKFWLDSAGTQPVDVGLYSENTPGTPGASTGSNELTVQADGLWPAMWDRDGDQDHVWVQIGTASSPGALYRIFCDADQRADELVAQATAAAASLFRLGSSGSQLPTATNVNVIDEGSSPRPFEHFDGYLWGTGASGEIYRSTDAGENWTQVGTAPVRLARMAKAADGEMVGIGPVAAYRSSGWATNSLTATWSLRSSVSPGTSQHQPFSFSGQGNKFILCEYSSTRADSKWVKVSLDGGLTWSVAWDTSLRFPASHADSHLHAACYDPFEDRFWFTEGHGGPKGAYYSDDDGATWTRLTGGVADTLEPLPTVMVATDDGIVCGTDAPTFGAYGIRRTDDPADMQMQPLWRWQTAKDGTIGFGEVGWRDPRDGLVYISFYSAIADVYPVVTVGTASGVTKAWTSPDDGLEARVWGAWVTVDDTFVAHTATAGNTTQRRATGKLSRPGTHSANMADAGNALTGDAGGINTSVAIGGGAVTNARQQSVAIGNFAAASSGVDGKGTAVGYSTVAQDRSVALGANAASSGVDAVAIGSLAAAAQNATAVGQAATASAIGATALGKSTTASNTNSLAVGQVTTASGPSSTSVGVGASATGTNATALGNSAQATSNNCLAVGFGASVNQAEGTAVGRNAVVTQSEATALGDTAAANGNQGTAVGGNATVASGHTQAVALGYGTTTTAANQIQGGARHIELSELGADPAAPAANSGRLYFRDNGSGKTQLVARFPTGAVQVIATEP